MKLPPSMLLLLRLTATSLGLISLAACIVDTDIPRDAFLNCLDDDHCPEDWTCDPASALCLPPGASSPVDPELAEARLAFCEAIWEAAQPCPEELEEALGEDAQAFSLPKPTFVHLCRTSILAETTTDDVDDLLMGAALVPHLSCEGLANLLSEELDSHED